MLIVNIPKEINRFCPKCKKHVVQKISIYKAGKRRGTAAGERRHALRKKGYGGQKFPKLAKPAKTSKKVRNIQHKNTVYFCIDDENLPYRGVRGKALVKVSTNVEDDIPVAERIMIKYTGDLENKVAKTLMDGVKAGQSAILEISPLYYSTWDHSDT